MAIPSLSGSFTKPLAQVAKQSASSPVLSAEAADSLVIAQSNTPKHALSRIGRFALKVLVKGYLSVLPRLASGRSRFMTPEAYSKQLKLPLETVYFKSLDDLKLKGYWFPHPTMASGKSVILGHGYTANAGDMLALVKMYHELGYNAFLLNFRVHSGSAGKHSSIGYHEGKDIAGALDYLKCHHREQANNITYHGHSMGAAAFLLAPKSLQEFPQARNQLLKGIDSAILDSSYHVIKPSDDPFVTRFTQMNAERKWYDRILNPIKSKLKVLVSAFEEQSKDLMQLPKPLTELYPAKIYAEAQDFHTKPLLIMHGAQDTRTPFAEGQAIYETLKASQANVAPMATLAADHAASRWKPTPKSGPYHSILRDEVKYQSAVSQFLKTGHASQ